MSFNLIIKTQQLKLNLISENKISLFIIIILFLYSNLQVIFAIIFIKN